jgi:hypothetical protein
VPGVGFRGAGAKGEQDNGRGNSSISSEPSHAGFL